MALWFRARRYGWGWTPATVQGWLVMAVFVIGIIVGAVRFGDRLRSGSDMRSALIMFYLWIAVFVVALVVVCCITGERPRWRWGDDR